MHHGFVRRRGVIADVEHVGSRLLPPHVVGFGEVNGCSEWYLIETRYLALAIRGRHHLLVDLFSWHTPLVFPKAKTETLAGTKVGNGLKPNPHGLYSSGFQGTETHRHCRTIGTYAHDTIATARLAEIIGIFVGTVETCFHGVVPPEGGVFSGIVGL